MVLKKISLALLCLASVRAFTIPQKSEVDQISSLGKRGDGNNEHCIISYDLTGASNQAFCLATGTARFAATYNIYTIPSGVGFLDCQKECKRNFNCGSTSWKNGACSLYSEINLSNIGFTPGGGDPGTIWNNRECFDMNGLCLLHDNSFEVPLSAKGVSHPWFIQPGNDPKSNVSIVTNQQFPQFKPSPSGSSYLRALIHGMDNRDIYQDMKIDTDIRDFTLSYNWIYQSYKVLSGKPTKPNVAVVRVGYCGDMLDTFTIGLDEPMNVKWQTRTVSTTLSYCGNEWPYFQFHIEVDPGAAAAGDYLNAFGFDNIQMIPKAA